MPHEPILRQQLAELIRGGNAFTPLEHALENIPYNKTGIVPEGLPYSLWQLTEHLRITQHDIYDFCINPEYQPIKWPDAYWPASTAPENEQAWQQTTRQVLADRQQMIQLVEDSRKELYAPFPHGDGQNLLREALLVAEHNAYHTGQIVLVRRLLGIW